MSDLLIKSDAEISECGRYRYWLSRQWGGNALLLPIIMLNPSTANASVDDPTIRRCMGFARREGYGGISVFNLFAYRATSPVDMMAADDPFGPDGTLHIERALNGAAITGVPVLAAWGVHGSYLGRAEMVMLSAKGWGVPLVCLGTTRAGHPKHPLYVAGDQPFIPFGEAA